MAYSTAPPSQNSNNKSHGQQEPPAGRPNVAERLPVHGIYGVLTGRQANVKRTESNGRGGRSSFCLARRRRVVLGSTRGTGGKGGGAGGSGWPWGSPGRRRVSVGA